MRRTIAPIAAILVFLFAGCGGSSPSSQTRTEARRAARLHVVDHRTAVRLLAWATRLRVCYSARELAPGRVSISPRQLSIDVDPSVPPSLLTGETLACVSTLGKPPARATFRTRRGGEVIALPRGYRLDDKTLGGGGGGP
jgi:hypothetical protein